MTEGEGAVPNCIMGFKACYPSFQCEGCMFWRNGRCDYEAIVAIEESVDQLGTVYPELSKPQLRVLARFAEFLKRKGISYTRRRKLNTEAPIRLDINCSNSPSRDRSPGGNRASGIPPLSEPI